MNERDFFSRFTGLLENIKDSYGFDNIHDALIVWFGENCLFLDPQETIERIVDDKHAEGVDAILIDQINYTLFFIQAKTVNTFEKTKNNFPETIIKSTLGGIRFLLKGDYKRKITPELENLVNEYHELDKTGDYKTKILFLTLKKQPIDDKFMKSFNTDFPRIEVDFFDFDRLFDFYENKYLIMRAAPPGKISFEVLTNLLTKDIPIKSRVFTCRGKELAKIYNDYRERIFQQNVRYSLGLRSKSINRQILETAINDVRSRDFWYFNNGITIVCKRITEASSGKVINLDSAQIINGAQTTYALFEAYKNGELKEDVEVLLKVVETNDRNFIENITLYTNSQNAIRLRDLSSNDEIQIATQNILLKSYRYFYERKRGEFDSLYPTIASKKKLLGGDYKFKVISNENASQAFLAMFLNKPAQAKSERGRIFLKDKAGFYDDIFNKNDELLPEKMLLSWKLLKYIEIYKKSYKDIYRSAENLSKDEIKEIYMYDFILHSEYFILNIFRDFLLNIGFKINDDRSDILKAVQLIDSDDEQFKQIYKEIKKELSLCIENLREKPGYYHNKFFKNEKSIGLIRDHFSKKYTFVEVLQ